MKKAILLSGYMKCFYNMIDNFYDNVFDKDTDLFIYYVENTIFNCSHNGKNINDDDMKKILYNKFGNNIKILKKRNDDELKERNLIYNKKKDLFKNFEYSSCFYNIKTKTLSNIVVDQFYNLYKITNLFKEYVENNNIKYDIVIKGRFDRLLYMNKINFDKYNYPNREFICIGGYLREWVSDSFFFGSYKSMLYICSNFINEMYNYNDKKYYPLKKYEHTTILAPERQLYLYLKDKKENNFEIIDLKISFKLISNNKCNLCAYYITHFR